jgi:RHS repeat-associated protein
MNGTSSGASANTFLAYDSNGNTIIDDQAHVLKYDAWNRLTVTADLAGNVKMTYTYDGLGRRIGEKNGAATDLYSTDGWQILEERTGVSAGNSGIVKSQNVWSPVYVNALILRARDADNDGSHTLEERLYAMQDANYNVTGIANTSGSVQERFVYDAYGKVSVKDASWANATDSRNWLVTYQGGRFNAATNLYYFDLRGYSPTMMKWIQADPAGYMDSLNRYGFVRNSPLLSVDPEGLATLTQIVTTDAPSVPKTLGDKVIDSVLNGDGKVIPTTLTNTGRLVPQSSVSGLSTAGGLTIIAAEAYWIWWKCDSEAQKTQQYYDQQMAAEREGARVQQQIRQWKLSHPNGNGGGTSKTSTRTTTPGNYTDPQTSGGGQQPPSKPPTNTATGQCDPDDEGNRPPNLTPDGAGRNGAFRQAKEDAGIPRSQQPVRVREVPDRQSPGRMTREYDFEIPKPGGGTRTVTIQEHPNGHVYPDNPSQNRGPHFNGPNGGHYDY